MRVHARGHQPRGASSNRLHDPTTGATGAQFDSNRTSDKAFRFKVDKVIQGWEKGVLGDAFARVAEASSTYWVMMQQHGLRSAVSGVGGRV